LIRRKSTTWLRSLILLVAVIGLGVMLLRIAGLLPQAAPPVAITESTPPTTTQAAFVRPDIPVATGSISPTEENGHLETPADQWANAILDFTLPVLNENAAPADQQLAWWYTTPDRGVLSQENGILTINQQRVTIAESQTIQIAISEPLRPDSLRLIGEANPTDSALQLTLNVSLMDQESNRWLLSGAEPMLAIEALSAQAAARDIRLTVAYARAGSTIQFVVLAAESVTADGSPTSPSQSQSPTATSSVAITPTSTRAPDTFLGQIVASRIDPGIDEALKISPVLTQNFIARHPWTGVLAASENGITINNRATSIAQATELIVYLLQDSSNNVTRLFSVEYTQDGTTRFPEDQLLFQAHRMEEILYWIVVRAAERDGQLIVAYDDSGGRQTITLIGFRKFPVSAP
jgi:hypothetical protein